MAAERSRLELLRKLWEWVNQKPTTEKINNELLLAKCYKGKTVFHMATEWKRPELLYKIWEWANEKLRTEEINKKLLLTTDGEEEPSFIWQQNRAY
jgi:hypothetical protein